MDIKLFENYLWVSGVTLGIGGIADPNGQFYVNTIVEPGIAPLTKTPASTSSKYVLMVSGLNYGSDCQDSAISRGLLLDFINGNLSVYLEYHDAPIYYLEFSGFCNCQSSYRREHNVCSNQIV